ncbi:hypothetical protein N657DRAFT_721049 [Parathielavia appendiculata]|uniref:Uncharacterized protein n=1 Tax=Parathielavia appendiculata TaxID=2587402 RepID=A0AAN6TXE6_9PEZI|nr:hypothetical protein N657DRAFT_721049 [Parathielavia appendiculata]
MGQPGTMSDASRGTAWSAVSRISPRPFKSASFKPPRGSVPGTRADFSLLGTCNIITSWHASQHPVPGLSVDRSLSCPGLLACLRSRQIVPRSVMYALFSTFRSERGCERLQLR